MYLVRLTTLFIALPLLILVYIGAVCWDLIFPSVVERNKLSYRFETFIEDFERRML